MPNTPHQHGTNTFRTKCIFVWQDQAWGDTSVYQQRLHVMITNKYYLLIHSKQLCYTTHISISFNIYLCSNEAWLIIQTQHTTLDAMKLDSGIKKKSDHVRITITVLNLIFSIQNMYHVTWHCLEQDMSVGLMG